MKSMRTGSAMLTALLAIVLLALAAVIVPRAEQSQAGESARSRPLLANQLRVADVVRIALERGDEPAMVFERTLEDEIWKQIQPFAYPMQPFSIRQLVVQAASLETVGVIDPSQESTLDAAALGFEPAQGRVTFTRHDGSALSITLGRRGIAGRAYVRIDEDPMIHVVRQTLHDRALVMNPKEWRQRTLLEQVSVNIDAIERSHDNVSVTMQRQGTRWVMNEPVRTRIDATNMEEYITALSRAEHGGFVVDQPRELDRFGLRPPVATLVVKEVRKVEAHDGAIVDEPREQTLLIGSRVSAGSEDRFGMVAGSPVVVRLPGAMLQSLFRDPRLLADPTASGLLPADVKTIRIDGPDGDFRLQRDLEKWIALDHNNAEVPRMTVEALLEQLTTLRAPTLGFDPFPQQHAIANVTLTAFNNRLDTVRIAFDSNQRQWILENGDNVWRVHPEGLNLALRPADFGLTALD